MSTQPPETDGAAVPTCFRHQDRETYVSCTRCERPICPECMRDAPVGHQCVECVAEGQRSVRKTRTTFGGLPIASSKVTFTFMVINAVGYLAALIIPTFVESFAMWSYGVAYLGQWWRPVTGAFLHDWLLHLLVNMWALYVLGQMLEQRLGHVRFAILYLLSALGGSAMVYLFGTVAIGASGGIYGLFAALFVIAHQQGYSLQPFLPLILINVAINFFPGISWQGHLGGLIVGALVATAFVHAPRERRDVVQFGAAAGILVALLAIMTAGGPVAELPGLLEMLGFG